MHTPNLAAVWVTTHCNQELITTIAASFVYCKFDSITPSCAQHSHSCGACAVITNTVFPAVCLYYFWTASGALPMRIIMHTLVAVMLTALAAKLLVEGVHTLPKYCKTRGMTTLGEPQHCPTVLSAVQATDHVHTLVCWNVSAVQHVMCTY